MVWTGSKWARNRGSYDDALLMRKGTVLQNGARDAIGARGRRSETLLSGVLWRSAKKKSRDPSVGDAERVSAREPALGKLSAGSAL